MLHRLLVLALLAPLAGCDSFGDDPYEDPFANVYALDASDAAGAPVLDGRIALVFNPSDVGSIPSVYAGTWDLDARGAFRGQPEAPDGEGSLRGDAEAAVELQLFEDDDYQEPLSFFLLYDRPEEPGADLSGRWELRGGFTGGVLATGTFVAELTRAATEFIIAG